MRAIRRLVSSVSSVVIAMGALHVAAADEIKDWPCEQPKVEKLSVQDLGDGLPAVPAGDWQKDDRASGVVKVATDPENPPARGTAEIESLAKATPGERDLVMGFVLAGIVDETNDLRGILIEGIRNNVIRAKLLSGVVADNEAALAAIPEGGSAADTKKRDEVAKARLWNLRGLENAQDDAEFLCHRLAYLDRKTRLLAESVRLHSAAP